MSLVKKLKYWKLYIPALLILLGSYQSKAQVNLYDTTWFSAKIEIGLNPTLLIQNTLWNGNNNFSLYPYDFMLNLRLDNGTILRSGWDVGFARQKNEDDRVTHGLNVGFRLGVEGRKPLSNKLAVFYGLDLTGLYQTNKTENKNLQGTVFTSEFDSSSFGMGPIMGVMFRLSDAVSIRTEASMYLSYTKNTSKFKSSTGSFEPVYEVSTETTMHFQSPVNLLLFFHF